MLVAIPVRDRPEALQRCLSALAAFGDTAHRVVAHADDPAEECMDVLEAADVDVVLHSLQRIGIAASLNKMLDLRERGEHFMRIDSDVEYVTPNFGVRLLASLDGFAAIAPGRPHGVGWTNPKLEPNTGVHAQQHLGVVGGTMLYSGEALDAIGRFHASETDLNFEDSDMARRLFHSGRISAYDTDVHAVEIGPKHKKRHGPEYERRIAEWRKRRRGYARGERLYQ